MTGKLRSTRAGSDGYNPGEKYGAKTDLTDFILGITFEIWEQGQVDKIHSYYADNVEVYSLEGMTRSSARMVSNTHATLAAFPDRLLLVGDVITTGTTVQGFSSHRIVSPMTNHGNTTFGPATGRKVQTMNIADCEVNNGMVTREWLVRDNLALIRQLGFEPLDCAQTIADHFDDRQTKWLASEYSRTSDCAAAKPTAGVQIDPVLSFARHVLNSCWVTGDNAKLESAYAPYCVLKRAPLHIISGRNDVLKHYAAWRSAFPHARLCVDHVCSQPFDQNNQRVAVRWSVAGLHEGEFGDAPASGKPVYILGVTHWQLVNGRIAAEWTVFDELSILAQTLN